MLLTNVGGHRTHWLRGLSGQEQAAAVSWSKKILPGLPLVSSMRLGLVALPLLALPLVTGFAALPLDSTHTHCQRRTHPPLAVDYDVPAAGPDDSLKRRFARSEEETGPRTSFAPSAAVAAPKEDDPTGASATSANEQLLAEIRALQPKPAEPRPEREPIDLNGINPGWLVVGGLSYGCFSYVAWQFTIAAAAFFSEHPMVRPRPDRLQTPSSRATSSATSRCSRSWGASHRPPPPPLRPLAGRTTPSTWCSV